MINEGSFWDADYSSNPALTPEMIAIAEKRLNVRLPVEFIHLLKISNGGYTKGFVYPVDFETSWDINKIPLHELFGIVIDESNETIHNILCTAYMTKEWGLPENQVLLSGDGHTWVTLDYRDSDNPCVR